MKDKSLYLIGGVVILIIILLYAFKDKFSTGDTDDTSKKQMAGDTDDLGGLYVPTGTSGGGSGGGSTTPQTITSISARFKTGKLLYKPTEWRDITTNVQDYVNNNGGVINIGIGSSWLKKFNLPLDWGIWQGLTSIQSPSAKIEFTFTTNLNPNSVTRTFSPTQKLLIP